MDLLSRRHICGSYPAAEYAFCPQAAAKIMMKKKKASSTSFLADSLVEIGFFPIVCRDFNLTVNRSTGFFRAGSSTYHLWWVLWATLGRPTTAPPRPESLG